MVRCGLLYAAETRRGRATALPLTPERRTGHGCVRPSLTHDPSSLRFPTGWSLFAADTPDLPDLLTLTMN